MSIQIAVRLPEDVVEFLDHAVADGRAASRAAVISSALEREMRRLAAERDAAVLARHPERDDLDALVDWTAGHLEIDD